MGEISIAVELREGRGKGPARRMRAAGRVPGVVYGHGKDAVSISFDPVHLERSIKSSHAGVNTLFDLTGESSLVGRTVIVKELQREPVRGHMVHCDFLELDLTERIEVNVPIHLEGIPVGVAMADGILDHALREIEISTLPGAIPDEIVLNVEALEIGDSLHVRDLVLPEGAELLTDPDLSVASVTVPRVVEVTEPEEVEPVEGEAAAAPVDGEPDEGDGDDS